MFDLVKQQYKDLHHDTIRSIVVTIIVGLALFFAAAPLLLRLCAVTAYSTLDIIMIRSDLRIARLKRQKQDLENSKTNNNA